MFNSACLPCWRIKIKQQERHQEHCKTYEDDLLRMDRAMHAAVAAKEYNRAAEILHYQLIATQVWCLFEGCSNIVVLIAQRSGFFMNETIEGHRATHLVFDAIRCQV